MIEKAILKGESLYRRKLKMLRRDIRIMLAQHLRGRGVAIRPVHVKALLHEPVQVAPAAGAGVQDAFARRVAAFHDLVEQVDVGVAQELRNSRDSRTNLSVRISYDDGKS